MLEPQRQGQQQPEQEPEEGQPPEEKQQSTSAAAVVAGMADVAVVIAAVAAVVGIGVAGIVAAGMAVAIAVAEVEAAHTEDVSHKTAAAVDSRMRDPPANVERTVERAVVELMQAVLDERNRQQGVAAVEKQLDSEKRPRPEEVEPARSMRAQTDPVEVAVAAAATICFVKVMQIARRFVTQNAMQPEWAAVTAETVRPKRERSKDRRGARTVDRSRS